MSPKKISSMSPKKMNSQPESKTENYLSIFLGACVVLLFGFFVFRYFNNINKNIKPAGEVKEENITPTITIIDKNGKVKSIPGTYKVREGDDLWHISESIYGSGYNWVDIAKENNIVNPDLIESGQDLKLPQVKIKTGDINGPGISTASTLAITTPTYKVVEGDFLWDIAIRACGDGYKWAKIAQDNNLINPDIIHPGNVFKINCK